MKSIQKKAALLAMFAVIAVSLVNAQEEGAEAEGIGLTAGIEFGFGNVADEAEIGITPNVVYENSFLDGALDVFAEVDYTVTLSDPDATHDVYIEEEIGYNLGVIEGGTLSIILNNWNWIQIEPALEDTEAHLGTFEPALQWTQTLGFGDLWAKFGFPIGYLPGEELPGEKDADTEIGLTTTVGWDSTFGLGVEFGVDVAIKPESDLAGFGLLLSYDGGLIYGEVELVADKKFEVIGIAPEIDVNLDFGLTIYAKAEIVIFNIEGFDMDPSFTPAIGVSYSF
jgi:hypothetical protein